MTQRQRIIWGYVSELVFATLMVCIALALDRNGVLLRVDVLKWAKRIHDVVAAYLFAGVFSFATLLAIPFGLIAFAGEDLKRRILEHEGFVDYVRAYAFTFIVLVCTYLLNSLLLVPGSLARYSVCVFLWMYCIVMLITAVKNAMDFLWLTQAMFRLERDIREGKYN